MIGDLELQRHVVDELEWEPSINAAHIGVTANKGVVSTPERICIGKPE